MLADLAYSGASSWATRPIRRLPHQDLTTTQQTITPGPCQPHEHPLNAASQD